MYVGGQQCNKIVSEVKIEVIVKTMAESAGKSAENSPSAAVEESVQSEGRLCEYSWCECVLTADLWQVYREISFIIFCSPMCAAGRRQRQSKKKQFFSSLRTILRERLSSFFTANVWVTI